MLKIDVTTDINESLYLRDPLKTELGKKIIKYSIELINEIGFEMITFKKIAERIGSVEASLYRYFENKYQLLSYLVAWYWDFMHFMIKLDTRNTESPKEKLLVAISTLVNSKNSMMTPDYLNHIKLHRLVVENASKVYHTVNVDKLNDEGYYSNYKQIVQTISNLITGIDNKFKYPAALATTLIEQSLSYEYYLVHLPKLTDNTIRAENPRQGTLSMLEYLLDRIL